MALKEVCRPGASAPHTAKQVLRLRPGRIEEEELCGDPATLQFGNHCSKSLSTRIYCILLRSRRSFRSVILLPQILICHFPVGLSPWTAGSLRIETIPYSFLSSCSQVLVQCLAHINCTIDSDNDDGREDYPMAQCNGVIFRCQEAHKIK